MLSDQITSPLSPFFLYIAVAVASSFCLPLHAQPSVSLLDSIVPTLPVYFGLPFGPELFFWKQKVAHSSGINGYRRENLGSSKKWMIENSRNPGSQQGATGVITQIVVPSPPASTLNTDVSPVTLPAKIISYAGGIKTGQQSTQSQTATSGNRAGFLRGLKERKKDPYGRSLTFVEISSELYSAIPANKDDARVLLNDFKKLPRAHDPAQREQYIKVNNILKTGVYGPGNVHGCSQFLDYLEYLEKMGAPKQAFSELHEHFHRWKLSDIDKSQEPVKAWLLQKATELSFRLMEQEGLIKQLERDWEKLSKRISNKIELSKIVSLLTKRYPSYDPHLYVKTIIYFHVQGVPFGKIEPAIKKIMVYVNLKWVKPADIELRELHEYLIWQVNSLKMPVSSEDKGRVSGLLELAQSRTKPQTYEMNFVYGMWHQYYKAIGYNEECDPINSKRTKIVRSFENKEFDVVLREVKEFEEERNGQLTKGLALTLRNYRLMSMAELYAQNRDLKIKSEALQLIPQQQSISDSSLLMFLSVVERFDQFELAKILAYRAILGGNIELKKAQMISVLQNLAVSTIFNDLSVGLYYYRLIFGTERFPGEAIGWGECPVGHVCDRVKVVLMNNYEWSEEKGLLLTEEMDVSLSMLLRNLRRFGYYGQAINLSQILVDSYFQLTESDRIESSLIGFYRRLVISLIEMSYANNQPEIAQKYLDQFVHLYGEEHHFIIVEELVNDQSNARMSLTDKHQENKLEYCKLSIEYHKLIYLIRRYQLNSFEPSGSGEELEIGLLFEDLWTNARSISHKDPDYRDISILKKNLLRIYNKFSNDLLKNVRSTPRNPSTSVALSEVQVPTHTEPTSSFIFLQELVLKDNDVSDKQDQP